MLHQRDNLSAFIDPRGERQLEVTYTDADNDSQAEEVTGETWGDGTLSLSYDFEERKVTVYDRGGNPTHYEHDESGHATRIQDASSAATTLAYNPDGLVTSITEPLGRSTTTTYDTGESRRSQGNATQVTVTADNRGPNGSSNAVTASATYDGRTNQPTHIVDPRGAVTDVARNAVGLPTSIKHGVGTPLANETKITTYNKHGQPEELVNANGHKTKLEYFTEGKSLGYLKSVTVDPGERKLLTKYETDARGNVIAVVNPREVRSERTLNEVGWVVEQRQAVTGSKDGAPALNYKTVYLFDENGAVTETRLPYGDSGSELTKQTFTYGGLGELLTMAAEIEPQGAVARTTRTYDANLNLTEQTGPDGQVQRITYNSRNLPASVTRGADAPEAVTETFAYDAERRSISRTDGRAAVWQIEYDGFGRVRQTLDPLSRKTTIAYDNAGNPTSQRSYSPEGDLMAESGTEYDILGRLTLERRMLWTPGVDGVRPIESRVEYDAIGHPKKLTDPLGRVTEMAYDAAERATGQTDPAGNKVEIQLDAVGNPALTIAHERTPEGGSVDVPTLRVFDAIDRPTTVRDGLLNAWQSVYDARGNVRAEIDPEGNLTAYSYDGLDRLTRTVQPEGIAITYGYDLSSRVTSYTDALGQATQWAYDAVNRKTQTTYPDATTEQFYYDPSGNLRQMRDARGSVIDQSFDLSGLLTDRTVAAAAGVGGPLTEHYGYDGLGRLVRAESGSDEVNRRYDSLSRLIQEDHGTKTVAYGYDDAGNQTRIDYPSGQKVGQTFDALDRPKTIGDMNGTGAGATVDPAVTYGYRGPSLVASKTLANGLAGTRQFDAARRPVSETFNNPAGLAVFEESLSWNPRGLKVAQSRGDLNGVGFVHAYDGADRLLQSANVAAPTGVAPNNGTTNPSTLAGLPQAFGFVYDKAQNLLARTTKDQGAPTTEAMPLDGSGRNRPSSVNGKALEWDANGNLTRKGDLRFYYDYRNRLIRVTNASGQEVARYNYDAFNRRTTKVVGSETRETVWNGWQAIEEYKDGQLASRRTYGLGIDEIVKLETDLNGDGVTESKTTPLYDSTGNLVALTDVNGKPFERYAYSPYGERTITVDATPPAVEQVRVKNGAVWMEMSEEVYLSMLLLAAETGKIELIDTATSQAVTLTVTQPVQGGLQARRRVVLTPESAPAAGTALRLTLQPEALVDFFHNRPAAAFVQTFAWPAVDTLVLDQTPPRVEQVMVRDRHFEVQLSEETDPAVAAAVLKVDGQTTTWILGDDRYTLTSTGEFQAGSHELFIGTEPLDLAGLSLAAAFESPVPVTTLTTIPYRRPDPRKTATSAAGNPFSFQGLPKDPETGLIYVRNRYYDPELGRFITTDPKGYVDGPNPYGYATNDPQNQRDPMGLETGTITNNCSAKTSNCYVPLTETEKSAAGYGVGLIESAGSAVWNSTPFPRALQSGQEAWMVWQAYKVGGLSAVIKIGKLLDEAHREQSKQMLLGLIPGVNTYREADKIIPTYETKGSFEGGRQVGRTTFSLALDATILYGAWEKFRATYPKAPPAAAPQPKVDYKNHGGEFLDDNERMVEQPYSPKVVSRSLSDLDSLRGATPAEIRQLIPKDWTAQPLKKGNGTRYLNPAKPGEAIMIEDGWPNATDPVHAVLTSESQRTGR